MASYASLITLFITILIISSASSSSSTTAANGTFEGHFTKIYAFGDSYTDTGNTKSSTGPNAFVYVSNPPYGSTFFGRSTNRYSDGRLVIDFVAEALSLPYSPPYLNKKADTSHGVNFAVAGSTAINHNFFVRNNLGLDITPQSIQTQLIWFNKFLASRGCRGTARSSGRCRELFDDALFWVGEIGANDYAYSIGSSVSSSTIQNLAVKSVTGVLQALLKKGAKYMVVQGLPLTGCLPLAMTLAATDDRDNIGCVASANNQSHSHNLILQAKLQDLRTQYPHAVIIYADYWHAYHVIMKYAVNFGFKEPFNACCGSSAAPYNFDVFATCGSPASRACPNPAQFINWDGVHLTEAMYKVVADMFLRNGYCQPSFKFLLSSKSRGAPTMASYASLITLFITILIISSASSSSTTAANGTLEGHFTKIYAFGDSYTDTGNTKSSTGPNAFAYVSNPPYGSTFFGRSTNRYSDGRLVIDFVAEALSLPYLPPYLNKKADTSHGVNFAVAGSTALNHSFFVKNNLSLDITPQSIQTQLIWFNKFLASRGCRGTARSSGRCREVFDDALFWVGEIGVNDYAYSLGSSVSSSTIQSLAVKSVTGVLQALLKRGAKYMVVQGLPLTGCLPLAMTLAATDDRDNIGCVASANNQSHSHNLILQAKLQDLRTQYPHAVIIYADYWHAYHVIMKYAVNFGFKEPFNACCGSSAAPYNFDVFATCGSPASRACPNPAQFINWDGVHLTEAMYKVVADMFLRNGYCQPSFKFLLSSKRRGG
ncbi:hypothetical protein HHK36_025099 [Tetracentron sinense]|uniref:Uncharacterized protein n=1 Tax=Tetracentron sinense TaxID=13715 RepID=A0A835D7C9_TETSI|nr:hypothetical protein HHK36_025099 [Tetracentron sinense]